MKPLVNSYQWMTDSEVEKIHAQSLEILWKRGMHIAHPRALSMLTDAGAKVEKGTGMVRFPPELVEQCLGTVPMRFVQGGRTAEQDQTIDPDKPPLVRTSSGAEGYIGLRSREYRAGTCDDLIEWVRLVDGLENVHICGGFYPVAVPAETADVYTVKTIFENTLKHGFVNPFDARCFQAMLDMAIAIRGSKNALRERPLFTILTSATAPSHILDYCIDLLFMAGEHGIPVEVNTSPLMGGTCPVTIAGCLLQVNVEILSLVTIAQLAHPGTPLIYRVITMGMDMADGEGVIGAMECSLAQMGLIQLVRSKYNLPIASYGPISDAPLCDGQSQIERSIQTVLAGLNGCQILLAAGFLDALFTVDPVQLTIDDEILDQLYRLMRGFDVNDDTLAKELIIQTGPSGNYLEADHTLKHFRSEHARPKCFDRATRKGWEEKGGRDLNQRAQERAMRILAERPRIPLDQKVQEELDRIYKRVLA